MRAAGRLSRSASVLFALTAGLSGCLIVQTAVVNPAPNLPVVAVAPFVNLSAEPTADGRRFALAYATELQQVPGFEVIPVGVSDVALARLGLDLSGPGDAARLAEAVGADAVVVGAITDYDPYYPPRVGLKIAWYGRDAPAFLPGPPTDPSARRALRDAAECDVPWWKRTTRTGGDLFRAQGPEGFAATEPPAPALPYMTYARLFDGADADVAAALRDRRALSGDLRSGGWEAGLRRSEDFIRFCCRRSIREMLELHGGLAGREYTWRAPDF